MSIWASIRLHDQDGTERQAKAYADRVGVGEPDVDLDVAVAWGEQIRLAAWSDDRPGIDLEVELTPESAEVLRDLLSEALRQGQASRERRSGG